MPTYDYECDKCGRKFEEVRMIAERDSVSCCGQKAIRLITIGSVITFKPMVYTDICETPILIESKKQLKEECKKHGVIAARLL